MLLLADSGSTKCSWCLLAAHQPPLYFTTEGYNPYFLDTPAITASLRAALPAALVPGAVRAVHFYGAGVLSPAHAEVVAGALRQVFPQAQQAQRWPRICWRQHGPCWAIRRGSCRYSGHGHQFLFV